MKNKIKIALLPIFAMLIGGYACSAWALSTICSDTDINYKNYYYIKGSADMLSTAGGNVLSSTPDVCINKTTLQEALCDENLKSYTVNYDCPYGCADGKCLESVSAYCTDSDIGYKSYHYILGTAVSTSAGGNILKKTSDVCESPKILKEAFCNADGTIYTLSHECSHGCKDGKCMTISDIAASCSDSDSDYKNYYYIKGGAVSKASDGNIVSEIQDVCINKSTLEESYCNADGTAYAKSYKCPNGCKDGQCVEEEEKQVKNYGNPGNKKPDFSLEQCNNARKNIANNYENFQSIKEKHVSVYANILTRANKFIARFDENNLDTSVIKLHLAELEKKIDKFKSDYTAYDEKFSELKSLGCEHSKGEFKSKLADSKISLKVVHSDAMDIRTYMNSTILSDIQLLNTQVGRKE